jgi:predicted chitinase
MNEKQIEMVKAALDAGITSPKEIANFVAQISHESANLTRMEESFRYTRGISQIPVKSAHREGDVVLESARKEALDGKPERLAELMYGGRMGNNEPGDGLKYHGRGYMQLTGKDNYREIGNRIGVDLVAQPDLASTKENASKIAVEFWKANVPLNAREDVTKACTAINGGENGLDERKKLYEQLVKEITPAYLEEIKSKDKAISPNKPDSEEVLAKNVPQSTAAPHVRPPGGYPLPDWSDLNKPIREYNQDDGTSKLYTFNSDGVLLREQNLDAKGNDMNPIVAVDKSQQMNVTHDQSHQPRLTPSLR